MWRPTTAVAAEPYGPLHHVRQKIFSQLSFITQGLCIFNWLGQGYRTHTHVAHPVCSDAAAASRVWGSAAAAADQDSLMLLFKP
jgi:hypothetical protein